MIPKQDSIVVGYVHPNIVTEGFTRSLAENCLDRDNPIVGIISASNPRQTVARNAVIDLFLKRDANWLMWIDTDMTFRHNAIGQLLATAKKHKADAVTGLGFIFKRNANVLVPNGYMFDPETNYFKEIEDYTKNKVHQIDGTGAGFVLIHRRVFETIGKDWHQNHIEHPVTGNPMGHDLAFFYEATQRHGFKLVWDTRIKTGHVKHFELDENMYDDYKASR